MPHLNDLAPLLALVALMAVSMAIGIAANRTVEKGGFMRGFFLGNRGLGSWSMALTATVMSGGTFMGFPSLVYKHGWSLALWICSYMVVPLCTFAVLGKRMGELSRKTGAITMPELFRERFQSPQLGLIASGLMVLILSVGLVAQFKGGALILQHVLPGLPKSGPTVLGQSPAFLWGLAIFTLVVVSYTVYGGFLAAVWTDLFQSVLMAIGVMALFPLALAAAGGAGGFWNGLEAGTRAGMEQAGPGFAFAPGGGAGWEFLPVGLAFSYFCMWSIAGMAQPATLVRLMAFRDTRTLRHATFLLAVYNTLIYLPLVFIFIAARAVLPELEKSDEVMPRMALAVASPWVSGLILAAPFGAVMATVSGYLVQISSGFVQDVYHRFVNPNASERTLRLLSHSFIIAVGLVAAGATIFSPEFLQAIIVFAGGAAACAFLFPAVMACFWRRANSQGAIASMVGGVGTVLALYVTGWILPGEPRIDTGGRWAPIYPLELAPFVWGIVVSIVCGVVFTLATPEPKRALTERFFGGPEAEDAAANA
ncbi:MAG: sodium:solute symporter family transporter [Armatimonadota bacterium]